MRGISLLAKELLTSQKGLSSIQLVGYYPTHFPLWRLMARRMDDRPVRGLHTWSYLTTEHTHKYGYGNVFGPIVIRAVLQIGRSLVRSQLVSLEFFIDIKSFRSHYGPAVDSDSNRN